MQSTHYEDAQPEPVFGAASRAVFSERYNRASYLFRHELRNNSLFSLPSLLELSRRQPQSPTYAHWSNGKVGIDDRWDVSHGPRYSLQDTISGIETNNSLAMLKHVERDTMLGPVVREIFATVFDLAGPQLSNDVIVGRGTILIASPRRLTSYHIDSDVNYLFQIIGDKSISVFDQNDRTLTTHEELERYYAGDQNGALFKEGRQKDAHTYDLRAGLGVHIPCMAAHWAQNRDSPSVALSINFDLRSIARLGQVYRVNNKIRGRGLVPTPPGISSWRDELKLAAVGALNAVRRLVGRAPASGSANS